MKKACKISLIVLGTVVGLLLAVNFLAGPIVKNYVLKHDKELLGRELSIKRVGVNLFVGKVRIKELTLFEDDGKTPFVRFEHFVTKIKLRDLLQHRLWVKRAMLSGLTVNVEQNRNWFNFNSLREHFASYETSSSDFGLVFNNVAIEKGSIRYADLALGSEFNLHDISLVIPSVDLSDLNTDVGLDLNLSETATLHTNLRLSNNAKKYFINLTLSNLGIEVVEPYLQQNYPVDLVDGFVNLNVEAQGPTDHILEFDLKGDALLNNVSLQGTDGKPLAKIDSIFARINHLNLNDKNLYFDQLYLSGLNLAYIIDADSISNFDFVLANRMDSTEVEPEFDTLLADLEEQKSWKVTVKDWALNDANVLFEDHTLPETFHYEISDIILTSKNFSLDGYNTIQMQAMLNTVGKLYVNWKGWLRGRDNHNLTLMLSNVKFTDFSPYAISMFGFPLEDGTLSFNSQNVISNGNIKGVNKLQVASPKLGNKVKGIQPPYARVPLKLGFYLLTDKHNNISIDLPVSGNLKDPRFSYRKALFKVFSNVLTKVASSPFRLMTDEENNLKYIPFDPLQFDFTPEQYVMIDNVVATLQSRSDLAILLEEKVQYDEVIEQLCVMQLQRDYYLSTHPDLKLSDIDFLTDEAIRSIKLNDKGLCEYAKQYSEKKKLHSKKDVLSVAHAVYQEKAERLLPKIMAGRNERLSDYLLNVKGLSPDQISVTTIDESLMKSFTKPSRYEMHVFTYEEME